MLRDPQAKPRAATALGAPTASKISLDLVKLRPLMALTAGSSDVAVALMDGPVARDHPDLAGARIRSVAGGATDTCSRLDSSACAHGTFVAGILVARRGSRAPGLCPDCTLLLRPIFKEFADSGQMPTATTEELAQAIAECVDTGARVLNLSAATGDPSTRIERGLQESLDYAASRGALVVAAAGNQGRLGSSAITRHPWVIPVGAYDSRGRPMSESNLGSSIGRRGLGAPGEVEGFGARGAPLTLGGTSFAAPFVAGTIALLWSRFPTASPSDIRSAVMHGQRGRAIVPPLLDASAAYEVMVAGLREPRS